MRKDEMSEDPLSWPSLAEKAREMDKLMEDWVKLTDDVSEVADIARELAPAARRALVRIARRLRAGQVKYGRLNLRTDKRDWAAEKREELMDWFVYDEFEEMQKEGANE